LLLVDFFAETPENREDVTWAISPMNNANLAPGRWLCVCSLLLGLWGAAVAPRPAMAGSTTTTLGVSLTINTACTVSAAPIAFSAQSVLSAAVSQTGSVVVTCSNTSPYTVQLDQGAGASATVANRLMTGPGSATVAYGLYQDAARTVNWGNAAGSWVAGTGAGNAQVLTVYGRILVQTTPAPGAYADTVNVTVSF
jgi:spore coat protein U-like protein